MGLKAPNRAEKTAERFLALSQVGTALMRELDETRLLHLIAQTACDLTGAMFAAFSLRPIDEEGQPLVPSEGQFFHLAAVVGVTSEQEALFRRMPLGGEGLLAPIFRQGVPVLVSDALSHLTKRPSYEATETTSHAKTSAREAAVAYAQGELTSSDLPSLGVPSGHPLVRSFLGAPLLDREGEVRGGLLLGHQNPEQFTDEDQTILVSLANQAAVALENARLYRMAHMRSQQLNALFESISDGITLVDGQGSIVRENRAARELRISPAATRMIDRLLYMPAQMALSGKREEQIVEMVNSHQEQRAYLVVSQPFHSHISLSGPLTHETDTEAREAQQDVTGAVITWHDITAQREQEATRAAQAHARQLEALFEAMTDAVFVVDREGQITFTNTAACRLLTRILPADATSLPIAEQFNRLVLLDTEGKTLSFDQWPASRILQGDVLAPEQAAEISIPTFDGDTLETQMTGGPLHGANGDLSGAVIIVRDVTRRKRAEREREQRDQEAKAEAKAQQELLQLIIDELPSSICLVRGPEARLMLANHAATNLWGAKWRYDQPMQDFLTEHHVQLYRSTGEPLPPKLWATLRAVRHGETARAYQETIRRPNGSNLPVQVNAVALGTTRRLARLPALFNRPNMQDAEPLGLVVHQDVTALKEAEYLKDEFIGLASHELRNPVAALSGFAQMLVTQTRRGRGAELAPWQSETLDEIALAAARLGELTEDLLDVTRVQAGRLHIQRSRTDLVELAQRMVTRQQLSTERCRLSLQASSSQIPALVDPARMEQVLSNLLNNAIKYSPGGCSIHVRLQEQQAKTQVLLSVHDHGIGIPKDQHKKIFTRFMRADNAQEAGISGTGLGLYLCRELVELHGGSIWFESKEGEGTTFFVALPQEASSA